MTGPFKTALLFSVGLHASALVGWPTTTTVAFDVERAPTSVEIVLVAPAKPEVVVAPAPQPTEPIPNPQPSILPEPDPVPHTVVTPEQQGVLTELLPSYLRNPPPVYPRLARERGYEGTVHVGAEVLSSGRCGQARVMRSSGYAILDETALQAVQGWQFKPATQGWRPAAVWVEIPITFRLIDAQQEE